MVTEDIQKYKCRWCQNTFDGVLKTVTHGTNPVICPKCGRLARVKEDII